MAKKEITIQKEVLSEIFQSVTPECVAEITHALRHYASDLRQPADQILANNNWIVNQTDEEYQRYVNKLNELSERGYD